MTKLKYLSALILGAFFCLSFSLIFGVQSVASQTEPQAVVFCSAESIFSITLSVRVRGGESDLYLMRIDDDATHTLTSLNRTNYDQWEVFTYTDRNVEPNKTYTYSVHTEPTRWSQIPDAMNTCRSQSGPVGELAHIACLERGEDYVILGYELGRDVHNPWVWVHTWQKNEARKLIVDTAPSFGEIRLETGRGSHPMSWRLYPGGSSHTRGNPLSAEVDCNPLGVSDNELSIFVEVETMSGDEGRVVAWYGPGFGRSMVCDSSCEMKFLPKCWHDFLQ